MSMDQRRVGKALGVVRKALGVVRKDPTGVPRDLSERQLEIIEKAQNAQAKIYEMRTKWEALKDRYDPDEWAAACEDNGWSSDPDFGDLLV